MTIITFFLTRHGETQWNKIGKLQGQLDSPLTEKGYKQAHAIAKQLSNVDINFMVSSTLSRAKKTADICQLSLGCSQRLSSALIERNFGLWQGKTIAQVKDNHNYHAIFHQTNHTAPPNGESGIQCATRFQQALTNIANEIVRTDNTNNYSLNKNHSQSKKNNILIVSHGDILRCFLSIMVNNFSTNQAINTQNKAFDNGCIFQIDYHIQQQNFTLNSVHDITQRSPMTLTQ